MVYVLVTIKVENYARWKATFDKKSVKREESGAKETRLFRNFENQNEIVILFEWDNLSNARKYMESDKIQKYLQDVAAEIVNISYLGEKETSI
jgi:quinol monooxygenase YgiN